MEKKKKDRLQKAGWKIGNVQEFLELSAEESAIIEMKLALAKSLKKLRQARRLT